MVLLRDLWPYLRPGAGAEHGPMQVDLGTILLAFAGLSVAVGFAVLAGTISARVFFDATRGQPEDKPH